MFWRGFFNPSILFNFILLNDSIYDPEYKIRKLPKGPGKSWSLSWDVEASEDVHLYLHFAEIQSLEPNKIREFSISWNGKIINDNYSPPNFMVDTVPIRTSTNCNDSCNIELVKPNVRSSTIS